MDKKAIGSRIRKIREGRKLNQREFGKLLSKSNASVSAYELGDSCAPLETLAEIAALGNVHVAWVILGDSLADSLDNLFPAEDIRLLKAFHKASDEDQKIIIRMAEAMGKGEKK